MKILILSDIHANWPALQAVVQAESDFDYLFFLGDLVDYGPDPEPCVDYIRRTANVYVQGNHDHALAFDVDCGCRQDFRDLSLSTRAWHQTLLPLIDIAFLQSMPVTMHTIVDGHHFWISHASPKGDLNAYLQPDEVVAAGHDISADTILVGHTHIPFLRQVDGKVFLNPGSVGLPRDRGNHAAYAVVESGRPELRSVAYDVQETIRGLRESPLPEEVVQRLIEILVKT